MPCHHARATAILLAPLAHHQERSPPAPGISADHVHPCVVDAIRGDHFYIFTHPEYVPTATPYRFASTIGIVFAIAPFGSG